MSNQLNFESLPAFLVAFLVIFLLVFRGKDVYAFFKFIDNRLTWLLSPFAEMVGATKRPMDSKGVWVRRLRILGFFLPLLALCFFLISRESPPQPGGTLSYLELAAVALLYFTALSIAKQWLANEGNLFDLEDTREDEKSGVVANHLNRVAIFSIFVIMVCVPISLHACHQCFGWGADLANFNACAIASLGLLADSFLNLGSLLNLNLGSAEDLQYL